MIVVFFTPLEADPSSGPITECVEATAETIEAMGRPYVEVADALTDWDAGYVVQGGAVVAQAAEVIEARALALARGRLRVRRDAILSETVDPIVMNPLRWGVLTADQQSALAAYRQALLDWPQVETDPLNPTPPTPPEL
jgi:hypothetical protein